MKTQIIAVPYDSARRDFRMGRGPGHLLGRGLEASVREAGHEVSSIMIEAPHTDRLAEIRTAFDLNRALAVCVQGAVKEGSFPVTLSGNCNSAVGTLAGTGQADTGVIWFDSHADLNTPETTASGFLDGMALAMIAGRCWTGMTEGVPGFRPVPEDRIVLVGARDFDAAEIDLLSKSDMVLVKPEAVKGEGVIEAMGPALAALDKHVRGVYVHMDLDILDPSEARANELAAPGGLSLVEVCTALRLIRQKFEIMAFALTAYDPACDPDERTLRAGFRIIDEILGGTTSS